MDAIELLKKDHEEVTMLFQRFTGKADRKVAEKICRELEVHAQIEEEIFYPAVREADRKLREQVDEAERDHARMKEQVRAIQARLAQEDETAEDLEGMVTALEQDVEHHVTEEEGEMFPQVADVMDENRRAELGQRLQSRKQELTGEGRSASRRAGRKTATASRAKSRGSRRTQAKKTGRRATATSGRANTSGRAKTRRRGRKASVGRKTGGRTTGGKKRARSGRGR